MSHKLALITVVYENYSILQDFFDSINKQKDKNLKLFIVDASINKKAIDLPDFEISVLYSENKGYAYGINTGITSALQEGFTLFSVLNCDTILKEDFTETVINQLNKYPSSLVGGKIYYASGYEYHHNRYEPKDLGRILWYAGGKIDWNHATTPHRGVDEVDIGQYDNFEETDFITGCLMCFDKKVINKIGRWDESYFLYYEDADYCVKAKKEGIKLYYCPSLVIWHKNAQSTKGSGSTFHQKYLVKNRLYFGLKYAPLRTKIHLLKNFTLNLLKTR